VRAKSNIGPDGGGINYTLNQVPLANYPNVAGSAVKWGVIVAGEARDLMGAAEPDGSDDGRSAIEEAQEFLLESLQVGPKSAKDLKLNADDAGVAWRTVLRAKANLGIVSRKSTFDSGWGWYLPDDAAASKDAKSTEESHPDAVATLGKVGNLGTLAEAF
jgi:putative DNA primase/helicase